MIDLFGSIIKIDSATGRVLMIAFFTLAAHAAVIFVRYLLNFVFADAISKPSGKLRSIASLTQSFLVFAFYFGASGLILRELGISLTAYLASATVIGLAVGFGSQGLVQDVVMGLTLVLSDLIDVGDMVEIGGQTGIIRSVGMRFVTLKNAMGADVYIPNRSIANVINYPRGYVRCQVDATLPSDPEAKEEVIRAVEDVSNAFVEQFAGILIRPHSIEGIIKALSGKEFLRVKFRIWPGRGGPIEGTFKQECLQRIKTIDPGYAEWMIAVYYEVEKPPELKNFME